MKTVVINENLTLEINGIRTKEGGLLIKRISKLMKKAQTDNEFRMAMNGLLTLVDQDKLSPGTILAALPMILSEFYDEFIGLMSDLIHIPVEEIEEFDIDKTIEVAMAIMEETDFEKVKNLLKNFKGLQTKFVK